MELLNLVSKDYVVPLNIPKSTAYKYQQVISRGYAKYLDAIFACGGVCMLNQLIDLIEYFEIKKLTYAGYAKRARVMLTKLEELGFVEIEYLNRNKYIILKHPAVALSDGDYKTHRRVSVKDLFRSDKFMCSITKFQSLLDYGYVSEYENVFKQLYSITGSILELINENGNLFGYDVDVIHDILNTTNYMDAISIVEDLPGHKCKLGIVRSIWVDIAKMYRKLYLKGCLIRKEPLHLSINIQSDGHVTLHYVPVIVIYDTFKGLDYYVKQDSFLSEGFFGINTNNTLGMKDDYQKKGKLGYEHFSRIGYTISLFGPSNSMLKLKAKALSETYHNGGIHSPMVKQCEYNEVDVDKYINHSYTTEGNDEMYNESMNKLKVAIDEMVGGMNGA